MNYLQPAVCIVLTLYVLYNSYRLSPGIVLLNAQCCPKGTDTDLLPFSVYILYRSYNFPFPVYVVWGKLCDGSNDWCHMCPF